MDPGDASQSEGGDWIVAIKIGENEYGIEYRADFSGLQEILKGEAMKTILRLEAVKVADMAKATAPRKTNAFASSIHATYPKVVEFVNEFGRTTRRAEVDIVADSDDALTVEFGAKNRYAHGQNRLGHHTLNNVVKVINGQYAINVRKQLEQFRARDISAKPGSPGGGPGTPGSGPEMAGGDPESNLAPPGL